MEFGGGFSDVSLNGKRPANAGHENEKNSPGMPQIREFLVDSIQIDAFCRVPFFPWK